MAAYSGAWARATRVNVQAPLTAPVDPEHLNPQPTPEFVDTSAAWQNSAPAPDLPADVLEGDVRASLATGYGPVNNEPLDHSYGPGAGHGLTQLESQDVMLEWHEADQGAVAAHEWHPAFEYGIGNPGPSSSFVPDEVGAGDSPQTLELQRTGYGQPNDPGARRAQRLQRWYQRYFNRGDGVDGYHRFGVEYRALVPQYARPTPTQFASGTAASQIDQPFPSAPGYLPTPPDRFVTPQMRRTPEPWDVPLTSDGTAGTITGAVNDYGLPSWGL